MDVHIEGLEDLVRDLVREEIAASQAAEQQGDWLDSKQAAAYAGLSGHDDPQPRLRGQAAPLRREVDALCSLDHTTGTFEVHEFDEDDPALGPVVVYRRRA